MSDSFTARIILPLICQALLGLAALTGPLASAQAAAPAATTIAQTAACPTLLKHNFLRLQDEKPQDLCQYSGKVVVVVNTASFCGFTPQYQGLEALYSQFKDKGLVVLGFPSNDFSQESGSNKEIADFCASTFGVKFPMFTKTNVTGKQANPLFKQLAAKTGTAPSWNFYKYVISRDGQSVISFNSMTDPKGRQFLNEIDKQLARP
ncbi:Hydroperoxy fatty acid reductase gpx1 [Polaromonas vacuolata]|uniref:Glutathione peroxidase n=1 Tax=Polaromonas vacuolata TaxID=37448 RepID=A0A6H2HEE9_9BURK|nr:glutathione peroxidase [Polaromonas vacuolata]QJC58127.1 Hydroperoxy fatty acid reductase gpx1 [Polaromonas vacuolata]